MPIWHLAIWQNSFFGQFRQSKIEVFQMAQVLAKPDTLGITVSICVGNWYKRSNIWKIPTELGNGQRSIASAKKENSWSLFSRRLSVHSRDQFRNLHLKGNPYLDPRWSIRGGPKLNANFNFKTKPFYCVHRIKKASASFSNCLSGLKKPIWML